MIPENTMPDANKKRVLILGAGFAGLYTALYLEKALGADAPAEITLIDQNHFHLFTPLLHEAASGVINPGLIMAPIRRILHGKRINFLRARVDAIDAQNQTVTFCCTQIPYDILVIALGSITNFYGLESVREKALEIKTANDANHLRCRIINRFEAATRESDPQRRQGLLTLAVVGGGCTGVETVAELHEFREHLREKQYDNIAPDEIRTVLVEIRDRVLPQMDRTLSRTALRRIQKMGIEVMLHTTVTNLTEIGLEFAGDQDSLPAATVVWAAGIQAHPVLDDLSSETDRMGRIVVDNNLRVSELPNVYVLGDAAHARHPETDEVYPPTAQVAYRQASVAAANIAADVRGESLQQFDFTYIGDLVSLGRLSGVADPFGFKLRGFSAWLMWKFYYLLSLVGWQNRMRVALNWLLALLFPANSTLSHECSQECDAELCL
ncbi:MAG: NAD(P)/FAD-dependent oxidoreductase [Chloroflexi bacterium]|nr:NAD(P)/FAD-dependent oxidoreductase [Chloroflexota bacterium]